MSSCCGFFLVLQQKDSTVLTTRILANGKLLFRGAIDGLDSRYMLYHGFIINNHLFSFVLATARGSGCSNAKNTAKISQLTAFFLGCINCQITAGPRLNLAITRSKLSEHRYSSTSHLIK
jgi:hypothetical protein